jgi:HD superfamily phosphohydrolase
VWESISAILSPWIKPILDRLARTGLSNKFPKTINDPIWGVIELFPWESLILDSPLIQRLRRVRQLGMAHYVYPGAVHNRLEHTLGVIETAERMVRALERNAKHHKKFGDRPDTAVPEPNEMDVYSTRLAGLFHDIGHGPFSHVTEALLRRCFLSEFDKAEQVLRENFAGVTKIATSETIAVLIVLSNNMREIFEHPRFGAVTPAAELAPAIAARILGSRSYLKATYLSGVISGPLDADKIDYMARDSHHSGLPIGLDMNRLISKLEVIIVTPEHAFNPELRERAINSPGQRFYEMGISLSGLGAYEQMIIGRVILYDRLYYHHKVRAAESMVRSLIRIVGEEVRPLKFHELMTTISDDATVAVLTGDVCSNQVPSGGERAKAAGTDILNRAVYHRAFAFAARFLGGLEGLPDEEEDEEEKDTRALLWNDILESLSSDEECAQLARTIHDKAVELAQRLPDLAGMGESLSPDYILIDLPINKAVVRGGDILTCDERGTVGTPNLYFDPEKWSQAYEQQKQVGFVFTPSRYIPLVALASRIVFFERFGMVTTPSGESASKNCGYRSTGLDNESGHCRIVLGGSGHGSDGR